MSAEVKGVDKDFITIEVKIPLKNTMQECEEAIQNGVNEVGELATNRSLLKFDTDGSAIKIGDINFTSKGRHQECYETPYGETLVERYVYQNSLGGKTYVPLEQGARLVLNSTPRFARIISFKYASIGANMVARDFKESHGRKISRGYIKNIADMVGTIAEAKESSWAYTLPEFKEEISSISLGLDGTCMLMKDDGWREAMAGSISFYNVEGDRLYTIYAGSAPEYGKENFKTKFESEIKRVKAIYPKATYVGLADGAKENWTYLNKFSKIQILDFYHVSEYVGSIGNILHKKNIKNRKEWMEQKLHDLKNKQGAAKKILNGFIELRTTIKNKKEKEVLEKTITYFKNHVSQMKYSTYIKNNLPIGSGVTEAACKTLIKERMCRSGMRWKDEGASFVITLRAIVLTKNRWEDFWGKYSKFGYLAN